MVNTGILGPGTRRPVLVSTLSPASGEPGSLVVSTDRLVVRTGRLVVTVWPDSCHNVVLERRSGR
jgi:hypothetical protein